jgi:histidinol-phosphate aminotransferase
VPQRRAGESGQGRARVGGGCAGWNGVIGKDREVMTERSEGSSPPPLFVRPAVRALAAYTPGEQPQDRRYIKLNTNENPYPPSPRVLEAVRACIDDHTRLYPDPLANALRDEAARAYGLTRDHLLAGNGSDDLLAIIIRACIDPGDRVVYPYPTYSLYDTLVEIAGGSAVRVPFGPDFALPEGVAEGHGRVTLICNPNSPSATIVPVARLAALAAEVAGLLVIDEAYVDFARQSALDLVRERSNVVILRTFSKSFSLAGMRIGLAFGPPAIIGELAKVKDSYNLSRPSICAAVAALRDREWMRANVERVCASRARLTEGLRALGFRVLPSEANFVLARRPGRDQRAVYEGLKRRGILVRYFATRELRDSLRVTVGTDSEVDALLAALRELGPAEHV